MSDDALAKAVANLRFSPQAIKWFLVAVQRGADPDYLMTHQADLLTFCLRNVYDRLGPAALETLRVLVATGRPVPFAEFAVPTELPSNSLREAVHELQQSALLELSSNGQDVTQLYSVTATANDFLTQVAGISRETVGAIRARDQRLRQAEERRQAEVRRRALGPATVHTRNEGDVAVAGILRQVLDASYRKNVDEARALLQRAAELAPDYFEVPRVSAFVESTAQVPSTRRQPCICVRTS